MGNETLRKLTRSYAAGQINKQDYRHQRSQLIDGMTARHAVPEEPKAAAEQTAATVTETTQIDATQIDATQIDTTAAIDRADTVYITDAATLPDPPSERFNHSSNRSGIPLHPATIRIILISATILAVVVIIGVTAKSGNNAIPPAATQASTVNQYTARQLVERFTGYDEWTSERVSEFVAGWQRLPEAEKEQAHQTQWFQDFNGVLRSRLIEQQKLADAGSGIAQQNVETINSIARLLRISL
jgi:hypothetical protein